MLQCGRMFCYSAANSFVAVRLDVLHRAARCFATVRQILLWHCGRMFCTERHDVLLYRGRLVGQRANSWPPCLQGWILLWCGTRLNRSVALGSKWVVCRYAVARLNMFVIGRFGAQATALRPSKAAAAPSNHRQRHSYLDSQRPIYLE